MNILLNDDGFGKNLRSLRKKRKQSQKEVASRAGISVYTVRWIEWGRLRELDAGVAEKLCEAVGGEMEQMLSGKK